MTKKLENASGNLKEILRAIADGEAVQLLNTLGHWRNYDPFRDKSPFALLEYKWRKKPDAFEEAWAAEFQKPLYKTFDRDSISKSHTIFKAGWDAAMEHKND